MHLLSLIGIILRDFSPELLYDVMHIFMRRNIYKLYVKEDNFPIKWAGVSQITWLFRRAG